MGAFGNILVQGLMKVQEKAAEFSSEVEESLVRFEGYSDRRLMEYYKSGRPAQKIAAERILRSRGYRKRSDNDNNND